jgi:hypothetical protein
VVGVPEELVESVDRGQRLVAIADVVLAVLGGGVAHVPQQATDRGILLAHAHGRAWEAHLRVPGTDAVLAGEKRRFQRQKVSRLIPKYRQVNAACWPCRW